MNITNDSFVQLDIYFTFYEAVLRRQSCMSKAHLRKCMEYNQLMLLIPCSIWSVLFTPSITLTMIISLTTYI